MSDGDRKPQQLANAFKLVAVADHFMVGVVGQYSDEEYADARASLQAELAVLGSERGTSRVGGEVHRRLELALALLDQAAAQPGVAEVDQRIWKKISRP